MRKLILAFLGFLLIALPVNGLFASDAHAATSRVAIIKELTGTVKVKKAGGSKEFTAFAKMTLNEGDIMTVGGSSSAVLQFANGSDEDDKMTVSANSKLTFSKLSTKKGTTTKVQLWSGSAWVDVKSIASSSDEFTLETPTAVMGVRGTHFILNVDPITGLTTATVAAGVVNTSTNTKDPNKKETKNVYPTQQVTVTNGPATPQLPSNVFISPIDLQQLISQASPEVIRSLIQSAGQINEENDVKEKQYRDQLLSNENEQLTLEQLQKFSNNLANLIGAIADQALKENKISKDELQKIVDDINKQTPTKPLDLTKNKLEITPDDVKKQEEQRKLIEEQIKKKQQELEQEKLKQQQEQIKKLLEKQKQLEEQRRQALLEQQKKALEEYEKKLSEAEKKRFKEDQAKLPNNAPSSTPKPSTSPSTSPSNSPSQTPQSNDATLSGFTVVKYDGLSSPTAVPGQNPQTITVDPSFNPELTNYTAEVPAAVNHVSVKAIKHDAGATITINGNPVQSGLYSSWISLEEGSNEIAIVVTAANGATRTYRVEITRRDIARLSGEEMHLAQIESRTYSGIAQLWNYNPDTENYDDIFPLTVHSDFDPGDIHVYEGVNVNEDAAIEGVEGTFPLSGMVPGWNQYLVVVGDPGSQNNAVYNVQIWAGTGNAYSPITYLSVMDNYGKGYETGMNTDWSWEIYVRSGADYLYLYPFLNEVSPFSVYGVQIDDDSDTIFVPNPDEDNLIRVPMTSGSIKGTLLLEVDERLVGIPLWIGINDSEPGYARPPEGIASWRAEVGPTEGEGERYVLPWSAATSDTYYMIEYLDNGMTWSFDALFSEGYSGKFADSTEDFKTSVYVSVRDYEIQLGLKVFNLIVKDPHGEQKTYHFVLITGEDPSPDGVTVQVNGLGIQALWNPDSYSYSLVMPKLPEGSTATLHASIENPAIQSVQWSGSNSSDQDLVIESQNNRFSIYYLNVVDVSGQSDLYPVYVYQGTPDFEGGNDITYQSQYYGWHSYIRSAYSDGQNWTTDLYAPELPAGYNMYVSSDDTEFEDIGNGDFKVSGPNGDTTNVYVVIVDESDRIVLRYILKVDYIEDLPPEGSV